MVQLETLFVFRAQVVATKTDESVTFVHTVRIHKQEASLAARAEKCLDLSFLNVFSGILTSCINGNYS